MSNQKKCSVDEVDTTAVTANEAASAFTEGERGWHKARNTKNLVTRLNANKCLVLSRYFKLLNAMDPNAVEAIWNKICDIEKPLQESLNYAMKESVIMARLDLRDKANTNESCDGQDTPESCDDQEEEEEEDHD